MPVDSTRPTYDLSLLDGSQSAWERSSGLRYLYGAFYGAIAKECCEGATLELGSGIGVSKEFIPGVITSDLVKTRYVDRAMSAYAIAKQEGGEGWSNIIALDVLHHLASPLSFFESAAQALRPGGRLVLMEPAATKFGRVFYSSFHHEPVRVKEIIPPFEFESNGPDGTFANMGMGVGLFERNGDVIGRTLTAYQLQVRAIRYQDVLAYPLTGGYSRKQMLPTCCLRWLHAMENRIPQPLMRRIGLRMLIVIEKVHALDLANKI